MVSRSPLSGLTPRRVVGGLLRRSRRTAATVRDARRDTRAALPANPTLTRLLPAPSRQALAPVHAELDLLTRFWHRNEFELLGSGWVDVSTPSPARAPWPDAVAKRARAHVTADPGPIGWHTDHKSGHTWPMQPHGQISYGDVPGVDVKVPWELARCQHLPLLALAAALDGDTDDTHGHARLVWSTIADFIAQNPTRIGVNWTCTMDVAIRAANWLVAMDLLSAQGHHPPPELLPIIAGALEDHARHIATNLEWYPDLRSNHYLANVSGMAFLAAYLPASAQATAWLQFAAAELVTAIDEQFGTDGANFEGSTAYHRLSAEMVAWSVAIIRLVPDVEARLAATVDPRLVPRASRHHQVPLDRAADVLTSVVDDRLRAMAAFTTAVTRPDGRVLQIGDNDSGRFLPLTPVWTTMSRREAHDRYANLSHVDLTDPDRSHPVPDHANHGHLLALIGALTGDRQPAESPDRHLLWDELVGAARRSDARPPTAPATAVGESGPLTRASGSPPSSQPGKVRRTFTFSPGGSGLDADVELALFPDFGLYVWRTRRMWLAVRCGPVGQAGNGGHAHADQLGLELWIDDAPWIVDPGTGVYTADPQMRNRYRSAGAHFVPWHPAGREPTPLDRGLFTMPDTTTSVVRGIGPRWFHGQHHGYGAPTSRWIQILPDGLRVVDDLPVAGPQEVFTITQPDQITFPAAVPHSPAYGFQERQP